MGFNENNHACYVIKINHLPWLLQVQIKLKNTSNQLEYSQLGKPLNPYTKSPKNLKHEKGREIERELLHIWKMGREATLN